MTGPELTASVVRLSNGRHLAFREYGDPTGTPVFAFHGTPGCRLEFAPTSRLLIPSGYRLIAPDRPGYGFSTFYRERRLVDWPHDVAALADVLGIERFAVLGLSGGGPHALACAHALPARLLGAACVSGVGPLADPRASEGMLRMNRIVSVFARHAPWLIAAFFRLQMRSVLNDPERMLDTFARQLPPPDQALLADAELRAKLIDDLRASPVTGPRAAAQDFALFASDWGFELADIRTTVHFFQGGVDRNVPAAHAELMAGETPGAVLHRYPEEGHLFVMHRLAEILATIVAPNVSNAEFKARAS